MKTKILVVFLFVSLILSHFTSCNSKESEFKEVASITYTVDGKEKTETSSAYMSVGLAERASEEEYNNADPKYQVTQAYIKTPLTQSTKTVSSVLGFDNSDKGKYLYVRELAWGSICFGRNNVRGKDYDYAFYKHEIKSEIYYHYIWVNIVDDDTIVIINSNGKTTYNVSSYRITNFI